MKVEVECCEGKDEYTDCMKSRCPLYKEAKYEVDRTWPYVGTGFGNLYGNPGHGTYLSEVRASLGEEAKQQEITLGAEVDSEESEYLKKRDEEREPINYSDYM